MNSLAEVSNPWNEVEVVVFNNPRKGNNSGINEITKDESRLQFFFIDCFLQIYSPTVCIFIWQLFSAFRIFVYNIKTKKIIMSQADQC